MTSGRWQEFWQTQGKNASSIDEQSQVLRTFNKQPVSPEAWQATLGYLDRVFPVGPDDRLLDLCCGNGLFTAHFAPRCRAVTSIDISQDFLETLKGRGLPNVATQCADITTLDFPGGTFSRILLYAGIQYLDEAQTIRLFRKMANWLTAGGILYIGDIPDRKRLWSFYNTPERKSLYFANSLSNKDIVGTWFDGEWLLYLADDAGFTGVQILPQPPEQIYAHFRYDLKVHK